MRFFSLFLLLTLSFLLVGIISEGMLNTQELLMNSLINQVSTNQVERIIRIQERWWWLGYALMPIILICKLAAVTLTLYTGVLLMEVEANFKKLFYLVIQAEFIFVASAFIKPLWLYFVQDGFSIEDLQYWQPISLLSILSRENLSSWSIYPLQLINIFELVYWLVLAYGLQILIRSSFKKALGIVAASYGTGLVLWAVFITFLTVSLGV